jgi:hypothetical protein
VASSADGTHILAVERQVHTGRAVTKALSGEVWSSADIMYLGSTFMEGNLFLLLSSSGVVTED